MSNIIFAQYDISSPIGERWGRNHNGIDFAVPLNTEVQTVTGGTVTFTGYDADGYGNYIRVADYNGNIHTYAHLNSITTAPGETVNPGEVIGLSGNTGRSTGAHVHYEVRDYSGAVLDGMGFINQYQTGTATGTLTGGGSVTSAIAKIATAIVLIVLAGLSCVFLTKSFS